MSENEDDLLIFDDFELVDDEQASILHTKPVEDLDYYIEFDVFTRELTELSPVKIVKPRSFRHNIFVKKADDIIKKLLSAKIPTSKVKVQFNPITHEHSLAIEDQSRYSFSQYFFIQNKKDVRSPIHLDCNIVLKQIVVTLNSDEFKKYISSYNLNENEIKLSDEIKFYCFNENNPTLLQGGFTVNSDDLLKNYQVVIPCHWLPNNPKEVERYTFIHQGANFNISYGLKEPQQESIVLERPQILYKQQGSTVLFQSIMNNADNYKIQDVVNFYCYKQDNPSELLFKLNVPKNKLDKFNNFSVKLKFSDKIKILSDHEHLYIEDNDVSTYYKF